MKRNKKGKDENGRKMFPEVLEQWNGGSTPRRSPVGLNLLRFSFFSRDFLSCSLTPDIVLLIPSFKLVPRNTIH
jgi:hypothetical protein